MNRKHLKRGAIATGLLIGAFALTSHAEPGERMMKRMAEKLDLTTEQQASIAEIRANYGGNREEMKAKRAEVKALVNSGEVDAAAELAATHARDAVYRRAQMRAELSEILTPEQLTQMEALIEERQSRGKRQHRRGFDDSNTGR